MRFRKLGLSVDTGQRGGLQETSGPAPQESIPHSGNECTNILEKTPFMKTYFYIHNFCFECFSIVDFSDIADIAKRCTAEINVADVVFDYIMTSWSAKEPKNFFDADNNFYFFVKIVMFLKLSVRLREHIGRNARSSLKTHIMI